jgi:transposase-like protein
MPAPSGDITSEEAARVLGVSRRTLYRWIDEGRIGYPIMQANLQPVSKRPRGPQANPNAKRYTQGRHTYRPRSRETVCTPTLDE